MTQYQHDAACVLTVLVRLSPVNITRIVSFVNTRLRFSTATSPWECNKRITLTFCVSGHEGMFVNMGELTSDDQLYVTLWLLYIMLQWSKNPGMTLRWCDLPEGAFSLTMICPSTLFAALGCVAFCVMRHREIRHDDPLFARSAYRSRDKKLLT